MCKEKCDLLNYIIMDKKKIQDDGMDIKLTKQYYDLWGKKKKKMIGVSADLVCFNFGSISEIRIRSVCIVCKIPN